MGITPLIQARFLASHWETNPFYLLRHQLRSQFLAQKELVLGDFHQPIY